jgi:hypothetical protein
MTDRAKKTAATKAEYVRVFDHMCMPPRDIIAQCSDGTWMRRAWVSGNRFGWRAWHKIG